MASRANKVSSQANKVFSRKNKVASQASEVSSRNNKEASRENTVAGRDSKFSMKQHSISFHMPMISTPPSWHLVKKFTRSTAQQTNNNSIYLDTSEELAEPLVLLTDLESQLPGVTHYKNRNL